MAEFKKHDVFNLLVSDCGDVIGPSGKTLKLRVSNSGYARVVVYVDGKHKSVLVHRLVAELFLSGPKKEQVNHIDGNKRNNNAANLEWCTRSENSKHAVLIGLYKPPTVTEKFLQAARKRGEKLRNSGELKGEKHPRSKLNNEIVRAIRNEPDTKYGTAPWNRYGISKVMYRNIRIGKSWSHI